MIREAISILMDKKDLTYDMMEQVMDEIMTGEATDAQKASFLTALAARGETVEEIAAAAKVMRAHCEAFHNDRDVLEIVGTEGTVPIRLIFLRCHPLSLRQRAILWQSMETGQRAVNAVQRIALRPLG